MAAYGNGATVFTAQLPVSGWHVCLGGNDSGIEIIKLNGRFLAAQIGERS